MMSPSFMSSSMSAVASYPKRQRTRFRVSGPPPAFPEAPDDAASNAGGMLDGGGIPRGEPEGDESLRAVGPPGVRCAGDDEATENTDPNGNSGMPAPPSALASSSASLRAAWMYFVSREVQYSFCRSFDAWRKRSFWIAIMASIGSLSMHALCLSAILTRCESRCCIVKNLSLACLSFNSFSRSFSTLSAPCFTSSAAFLFL
mmetsp:Transcript_40552/g.96023  ORF Transcript_40552/g.96023 Transcript_40552/m.96023 type:complete len:202 (-) Transcript_40552:533-1138(-)